MRGERQRERQPEARREGRGNADNEGERLLNHGTKKMSIECDMYDDDDDGKRETADILTLSPFKNFPLNF